MASHPDTLLKTYRQKRDFAKTREPSGERASRKGGELAFVVQKHDATRLHYDFRVEWDGVLKSWAVAKGPSLDPADKRLAVRTEDHPLDYGDFEGTIPKGEYGGGTVMLWDRGTWEPQEDASAGLRDGMLKMVLHGEKMKGHWALVRMKPRGGEKRENWLLIKEKDDLADPGTHFLAPDSKSVKTGRAMDEIAAEAAPTSFKPTRAAAKAERAAMPAAKRSPSPRAKQAGAKAVGKLPRFRPVQLATLVDAAPEGDGWLHEMKYDGYRVLIAVGGGEVRLYTRNELDWTDRFGFLVPAAKALACDSALIDGEVVAFDAKGKTDFSTLQQHLSTGGDLSCFCFDLLELDGENLAARPLIERKERLAGLIGTGASKVLLYSEHVRGHGGEVFKRICAAGHEGIVSKEADAPYRGMRTKSWLKTKCTRRQEFVIAGWSPSDKKDRPFASILLGVNGPEGLVYRGRVGSGFNEALLGDLKSRFDELSRASSPFAKALPAEARRGARFVEPALVAEIEFTELTADGHIRHGVFKGLREDKEASAVKDEIPAPANDAGKTKAPAGPKPPEAKRNAAGDAVVAGVRLSHPDRVLFEEHGLTKLDLAQYYAQVAERMLVHAGRRPVSLVRCPQGGEKHCFFQKHDSGGFPDVIRKIPIEEKDGGKADYLYVEDAAGLVAAVQMGTLEFHIWGSHTDMIEKPDRLVFDLDPDEGLDFGDVKRAAAAIRDRLADLGIETFPMLTGGKGVHIIAPLGRRQSWEELKAFARGFALRLAEEEPERYVATMSKAKRKGRIFIDWLRNERGATAVAPYSTRSRKGAPVATPVAWEELAGLDRANGFDTAAVIERVAKTADPWPGYGKARQSITRAMLKAVGAG